jgi:ppGpp synthetase/RelA/SpoT-type nucleotidyltranferase
MPLLTRAAQGFLRTYTGDYTTAKQAAEIARLVVEGIVRELSVPIHVISSRAKTPQSLRIKLRQKKYIRPSHEVTDTIGVRVITYYRDDVDRIADRLTKEFDIDRKNTVDKRLALGVREFGYRSVQLIARLKAAQVLTTDHRHLRDRWFEIQIRSILEHAWAEIEHEIVYKAGVRYSDSIIRRWAALAGSLELLDSEFLSLRAARDELILTYREQYKQATAPRRRFDVARLLGFLEAVRPQGRSWRQAVVEGTPFAAGLDASCVDALKAVGLGTPASLRAVMHLPLFRYCIRSFATSQGIAPAEVSHLAIVVIAVATKNARMLQHHFPEIMYDPAVIALVRRLIG